MSFSLNAYFPFPLNAYFPIFLLMHIFLLLLMHIFLFLLVHIFLFLLMQIFLFLFMHIFLFPFFHIFLFHFIAHAFPAEHIPIDRSFVFCIYSTYVACSYAYFYISACDDMCMYYALCRCPVMREAVAPVLSLSRNLPRLQHAQSTR